jgi:hypothetical protein
MPLSRPDMQWVSLYAHRGQAHINLWPFFQVLRHAAPCSSAKKPHKRSLLRSRGAPLQALVASMDAHNVSVVAYPTWSNPPALVGDTTTPDGNNSPAVAPHTGAPALTVPMGFSREGAHILPNQAAPWCKACRCRWHTGTPSAALYLRTAP